MLSVCPSGMELHLVLQYLLLQQLPQTLQTLLGEQDCSDIRALAALADRLWSSHKPHPHEVMAVQEQLVITRWQQSSPRRRHLRKSPAAAMATE